MANKEKNIYLFIAICQLKSIFPCMQAYSYALNNNYPIIIVKRITNFIHICLENVYFVPQENKRMCSGPFLNTDMI